MANIDVSFWQPVLPPSNRPLEGCSEVDVLVRFRATMVFVECKFRSPLATRTTHDENRDQLARLLDVAYQATIAEQFFPRAPYVLVIGVPREEPALVTRYRDPAALAEALRHHSRFPDHDRMTKLLARRVGYVSWSDLADILDTEAPRARRLERAFMVDVARYVRHKMATAARSNVQRQQLALPVVHPAVRREDEG